MILGHLLTNSKRTRYVWCHEHKIYDGIHNFCSTCWGFPPSRAIESGTSSLGWPGCFRKLTIFSLDSFASWRLFCLVASTPSNTDTLLVSQLLLQRDSSCAPAPTLCVVVHMWLWNLIHPHEDRHWCSKEDIFSFFIDDIWLWKIPQAVAWNASLEAVLHELGPATWLRLRRTTGKVTKKLGQRMTCVSL